MSDQQPTIIDDASQYDYIDMNQEYQTFGELIEGGANDTDYNNDDVINYYDEQISKEYQTKLGAGNGIPTTLKELFSMVKEPYTELKKNNIGSPIIIKDNGNDLDIQEHNDDETNTDEELSSSDEDNDKQGGFNSLFE